MADRRDSVRQARKSVVAGLGGAISVKYLVLGLASWSRGSLLTCFSPLSDPLGSCECYLVYAISTVYILNYRASGRTDRWRASEVGAGFVFLRAGSRRGAHARSAVW